MSDADFTRIALPIVLALATSACAAPPVGAPDQPSPVVAASSTPFQPLATQPSPAQAEDHDQPENDTQRNLVIPTAGPNPVFAWRPPPYQVPWAIRPEDHFYFLRPIPSGNVNWPHPRYRYGSTFFGEESTHTGVDLGADAGTLVVAAGPGEVIWAGYGLYRGVRDLTDPYGLAVAIRHEFGFQSELLYTVYAHLESISVWEGQIVDGGEPIGVVGTTGHASGPHLHFEVRVGENRYFTTRNPELWTAPPEGWGVLAGSILNSAGLPLEEELLEVRNLDTGQEWSVWTYAKDTIHPDPVYGENFVIGDLPSGPYEVRINHVGHAFQASFYLYPGRTNLLTFRGRSGFDIESGPSAPALAAPPWR